MGDNTLIYLFAGYAAVFVAVLGYVIRLIIMLRNLELEAARLSDRLMNRGTSE